MEPLNLDEDYMRKKGTKLENLEYEKDNPDKFKDENMYKYHENT